jgi:hypothetical protein
VGILFKAFHYSRFLEHKAGVDTVYAIPLDSTARILMYFQTMSTVESFVLAMMAYPEIQRIAQQEIDGITDRKRLPDFADRESLPYLNALFLELLRFEFMLC